MKRLLDTLLAWTPLALALAGVGITIVLVREHATVIEGGIAQGLFCGGAGRFDCSQVASHESSSVLGIPLALWGMIFYIEMAGLALAALVLGPANRARIGTAGFVLSVAAVIVDAYLAWVMLAQIGAVCLNCVVTYAINLLLVVAWWGLGRAGAARDAAPAEMAGPPRWALPAVALVTLTGMAAAVYFSWSPIDLTRRYAAEEAQEFLVQFQQPPAVDMSRFEGQPARGPAGAPVQIAVMSDFQCNYCRALASHLERLQRRHPEQIRVWFVNAPVSSKCHPLISSDIHEDACWLAEAGECADRAGRFWEYHDLLYHTIPHPRVTQFTVERRLAEAGLDPAAVRACLDRGEGREAMARDTTILRDLKLGSVPALVINGHVERGGIYPDALSAVVRSLLAKR